MDEQVSGQPGLASVEAAQVPEVMESLPPASDIAGIQDAPVRNHIADAQMGGRQAGPETPEKHR